MNLADLVRSSANDAPNRLALVSGERRVTWAELDSRVEAVARGLSGTGLVTGDRVAILLPNGIDFVAAWFGALRAGFVCVPLTRSLTDTEVVNQLTDCGAALLLADENRVGSIAAVAVPETPAVRAITVGGPEWTTWLANTGAEPGSYPASALAALIYTSGTSGRPRGVMLTHDALLANVQQAAQMARAPVAAGDVVLLVLPLSHVYALNGALSHVAAHAATAVLAERFDPVESLDLIEREGVTHLVGAPPMYVAWSMLPESAKRLRHIRLAVSGSAPLRSDIYDRFLEITGCPVYEGYGMTEASPILTSTLVADEPLPGSVGRPLPGVEIRVLSEDGQPVAEGRVGEIVVRGPNLFIGYWPDGNGGPDAQGWFATGDLGRFDVSGNLFLTGRKSGLIIVSGFNVDPREVENVLVRHPDIEQVAVIGIPHPYRGEAVKAFVVPRPGSDLTVAAVNAFAIARLARFKSPTAVELVTELPVDSRSRGIKG
jgi:long-chain acyl-CoA synthetase